ncbi:MAG: hypothetical protein KF864_06170 [Phycisphaeraceae bacterium]|nr:hypothetical protein [Phycisphaeraceae bacterium]
MSVDYLATLAKEIQTTLRRIATNKEGKTGRYSKEIERACSLDIVGFAKGSVRLAFELAPLPAEASSLWPDAGRESLERFIETLDAGESGRDDWSEGLSASVLDGFDRITRPLDDGITSIAFNLDSPSSRHPRRAVRVTKQFRERVRVMPSAPTPRGIVRIVGVIWEADWKDHTAELHQSDGRVVRVLFDAHRDEEITDARRLKVAATGTVASGTVIQPHAIRLDRLEVLDPSPLETPGDGVEFWEKPTVLQLAERQGVQPPASLDDLAGHWPDDDNIDDFLDTVRQSRQ